AQSRGEQRNSKARERDSNVCRQQKCDQWSPTFLPVIFYLYQKIHHLFADASTKTKRRKKKKNLFEVVQFLPNWGVGYHVAKAHWDEISYQITKLNLYKSGTHGKAWGVAHKDGTPIAEAPKKISGVHKRCWKYIASLPSSGDSDPSAEVQTS
ncbi:uncharacterized protein LOC111786741, partial [Cucurbita pepo subsp. pepo]